MDDTITAGTEHAPLHAIKDSIFRDLFSQPAYLLQLYKVLHPEDTTVTESDLGNVTIQNVLMGQLYNDLGFTVRDRMLILLEAQSTWTVNIAARLFLYAAETLNRYIQVTEQNMYAERRMKLPKFEFYVLYTGDRSARPQWICYADEFLDGDDSWMNIRIRVLYGDGDGDILNQYVSFTGVYNDQVRKHGRTETAIRETIRICTDQNILAEYLKTREQEVRTIMMTLFQQEYVTKLYGKEQRQAGLREGLEAGLEEGREEGQMIMLYRLVQNGMLSVPDAAEMTDQAEDVFLKNMQQYFADSCSEQEDDA